MREESLLLLIEPITRREMEVLALVAEGQTNQEIAVTLIVTEGTIKKHVSSLIGKLGAHTRAQAVIQGQKLGLLEQGERLSPIATAIAALILAYPEAYQEFLDARIIDMEGDHLIT